MTNLNGETYLRPGFVLALCVRLLTAALAIIIPLYAVDLLGLSPSAAGLDVLLLWIGNAGGVAFSVLGVRHQTYASTAGFVLVALAMWGIALLNGAASSYLTVLAGVGVGMPQPFLSAYMHTDSSPSRPFSGLGIYSTALGLGLILGPLVAFDVYPLFGFQGVFLALSAVCMVGVAAALLGHRNVSTRPRPQSVDPRSWGVMLRIVDFRRAIAVNFLYSLLLPVFLSYGAILAGSFHLTSPDSFLIFTGVFSISTALRFMAVRFEKRLGILLVIAAAVLVASTLALGLGDSRETFVFGMLAFSIPHAYVFPVSNFYALTSSQGRPMSASYAFQASSAVAEFITPALAVTLIPWAGVQGLFLVGGLVALGVLVASVPMRKGPLHGETSSQTEAL